MLADYPSFIMYYAKNPFDSPAPQVELRYVPTQQLEGVRPLKTTSCASSRP